MAEHKCIELNEKLTEDGLFNFYTLYDIDDEEFGYLKKDKFYLDAAKKTFDIANYAEREDPADEVALLKTARWKPEKEDDGHAISELFDAESILRESVKRDGGKNFTKLLKEEMEHDNYLPVEYLEYLAQHEFAAEILAANPDIVAAAKESFNVYNCGFRANYAVFETSMKNYAEKLEKIADSEVFKPYFDARRQIEESQKLDRNDAWAKGLAASEKRLSFIQLEIYFNEIVKALPTHPELIPLVANSLNVKRSDYPSDWHYDSDFESAKEEAKKLRESGKLTYECYVAAMKADKLEYAEFKDREEIIKTYLQQKDLNIFELKNCLEINSQITEEFIRSVPEIRERVEKLFENPRNYKVQEQFNDSPTLNKFFNVSEKLAVAEKNLRKMSGGEVFDILTQSVNDIPEAREAKRQMLMLQKYFNQTKGLSEYSPGADLYNSYYNDGKRWGSLNPLLNDVGTYKCSPEMAAVLEERIARIFAHHNYHDIPRHVARYSFISGAGMEHFAKEMTKALIKNPDSYQSKFYLKYSQYVLNQWQQFKSSYGDMATKVVPEMIKRGRLDISEKILYDMNTARGRIKEWTSENMRKELKKDVNSPVSKYYLERIESYFPSTETLAEVVADFVAADKGKHLPETERLCKALLKLYNHKGIMKENALEFENSLLDIYQHHKDADIADMLEKNSKDIEIKEDKSKQLFEYYEKWQHIGLKGFENVVDKILAETKELHLSDAAKHGKNIDFTALHEKFKTAGIEEIECDCKVSELKQLMQGHPHLRKITISSKAGLDDIPEIIAGCPNLEEIRHYTDGKHSKQDTQKLYEYLMTSRPERLFDVDYTFTYEQARNLMEKYLTLTVEVKYGESKEYEALMELRKRNEHIREIFRGYNMDGDEAKITDDKTLKKVIQSKGLAECLEIIPEERRPSFEKLCSSMDGFHDAVKKSYGNAYSKVIAKVAGLTGAVDFKNEIELRQAIAKDKVMEFLNGFADDKRPNVKLLNGHQVDDATPFENLAKKKKNRVELAAVIEAFRPSDNDLDALAAGSTAKSTLRGVVEYVKSERQEKVRKEKEKARFAQWKAKNIRDDK